MTSTRTLDTTPTPISTSTSTSPSASANNAHLQPPLHGACQCSETTYTLTAGPIRVNCCHCLDCRASSGAAFATNLILERAHVKITSTSQPTTTVSSRTGQSITRCGNCLVALWSTYPSAGPAVAFVRAGTLARAAEVRPDLHIYTRSKVDWVTLPEGVRRFEADSSGEPGCWTVEGRKRIEAVLEKDDPVEW